MFVASRGLRFLLAALLVFSQQQAVLHLLGHDLAQLSQKDTPDPREPACGKCLAIAHLDHAVSGDVAVFEPIASPPQRLVQPAVRPIDLAFVGAYRSRAPPVLS